MIRKPDDREFRESRTVSTLRDARTLTVEGARGVGQGTANLLKWWLTLMLGFGFVMSIVGSMGPVGILLLMGGGVAWFVHAGKRRRRRAEPGAPSAATLRQPRTAAVLGVDARGHYDLSVAAVGRSAAIIAVPAILLFPTTGFFTFMAPFTLIGVVVLALAILIVARLFGNRTVVSYDGETLTVRGLLGEGAMMWSDVEDVFVQKASVFNLIVLFTSGSRRNIVVTAGRNRLDGPDRLLIPYPLLGLDKEALVALVSRLLMLRSGMPIDMMEDGLRAAAPPQPVAAMEFDADAIMARYMQERDQVRAEAPPPAAGFSGPRTFGRKRA